MRFPVETQLRDDRRPVQTRSISADPIERRNLGHVDDVRAHADAAVPQDHVQVVRGTSNRRSGAARTTPVQSRPRRVDDQNVEPFVALSGSHARGKVNRSRPRRQRHPGRKAVEVGTHRAEGLRLAPRQAEAPGHLAAAVGPGADPVSHPAGLAEPADEATAFHGQHDAVKSGPRQTAGPHEIAAAPILENRELRRKQPAIRSRQLQPDRFAAQQLQVDLNRDRGDLRPEVLSGDSCRLSRPGRQRQQTLALDRRHAERERYNGQEPARPSTAPRAPV